MYKEAWEEPGKNNVTLISSLHGYGKQKKARSHTPLIIKN